MSLGDAVSDPSRLRQQNAPAALSWFPTPDRRLLVAAVLSQLVLAVLLGHANDMRIFMATGYFTATGQNPYVPQNLTTVFHHVLFDTRSTIGYPPPWPLLLGLIYRATYGAFHQFLLYSAAIKLPLVAANVGLAYLAAAVLRALGSPAAAARRAWTFLLFNPLLLYFTAAWGQVDGVVALLALAALVMLIAWRRDGAAQPAAPRPAADLPGGARRDGAALLLALAVCIKPVALPLAPVAALYLVTRSWRAAARFSLLFLGGVFLFYAVPFVVFGWQAHPATRVWHDVWDMTGTLSVTTIARAVWDPVVLPGRWWLLGMAWVPALAAALFVVRRGIADADDLLAKSLGLVMVFFLTRTWLSESNVVLALPFALLLTLRGRLDRRLLLALWVLPLVFTVAGWTPLDLLWVNFPATMQRTTADAARYLHAVILVRAALAVLWQVLGWWIVVTCLRRPAAQLGPAAGATQVAIGTAPGAAAARAPGATSGTGRMAQWN